MEQEIIQPIAKEVLKSELTPDRQLRMTNKSHNEIYIITAHNAPNVMKEIGRLREIAFREAGGGTGKSMDIDEFDTCDNCYKQLIVWNPEAEEIIGGYRYLLGTDWEYDEKGQPILATSHMFHFSEKFIKDYAPWTIELGRSFVSLPYQSSRMGAKSLFALDNLWDGLGALTVIKPNVMKEIGRLREIAFREAGGGTGKSMDIDEFDTCDNCYKQLIVWNPEAEEIIGGYRYLLGTDWEYDEKGQPILATSHMFHFSDRFIKDYAPWTIELGRSFVSLPYQSSRMGAKSLFALDNLWDGLGALTVIKPNVKYFFGKMTMYPSYIRKGRDMILYFLKKHFDDKDKLIIPMKPLELETDPKELESLFGGTSFKDDYRVLNGEIRKLGYNIPPLVNAYMSLSPTMKLFGTAINYGFGDVEETGILIAVDEILEEKRVRHIDSFIKEHPEALKITSGANQVIYKEK